MAFDKVVDSAILDAGLASVADAIRAKGGTNSQMSFPSGMVDAINAIQAGGGGSADSGGGIAGKIESGVIFIDYDGTVIDQWESSSVASKTVLPDNPEHDRLVAQGWNWSLENIKNYISKYPDSVVNVGQMYKTASGLTEFDITVTKATGLTVTCKMAGNKNWGDGTTNNKTSHTYLDYGDYTITCDGTSVPSGTSSSGGVFGSSSSNMNYYWCTAVRIGFAVTSIGNYAFNNCQSLTNITIPENVTSIGSNAFVSCYSLTNITIPDSVTSIGDSAFRSCYSLASITIPDSVTSLGNSMFRPCQSLTNITIPENVTSIGDFALIACYSLTNITIPENVTSIGDSSFGNCYSVTNYDFSAVIAIPTLSNANAFNGINGICKIIVPAALYDDWIVATNWATYADYIISV